MPYLNDKRIHTRITPSKNAPIIVDINGINFIDIFHATDISDGGIRITVAHGFQGCEINKQVSIAIKLPYPVNKSFTTIGLIKHLSGKSFGIHFLATPSRSKHLIKKYILFHTKQYSLWNKIRYRFHLY